MAGWWQEQSPERKQELFAQVLNWLAQGVISVPAGQKFPLARAAEAVILTHQAGHGAKPLLVLSSK